MPVAKIRKKKVRTTVTLPLELYEEARSVVGTAATPSVSLNGFIVSALRAYVNLIRRRHIDARFAGMSQDSEYQEEARRISEEFTSSDWEALDRSEKDTLS